MKPVCIVAASALSALGRGHAAFAVGAPGARAPDGIAVDPALVTDGLRRPFAARVSSSLAGETASLDPDRATRLLRLAVADLAAALDERCDGWRSLRVGIAIGTSGGAMDALRRAFVVRERREALSGDDARRTPYFAPLVALDALPEPVDGACVQVLAACASATLAIGLGCRWLALGHADLVIAGGYDALSTFIAAGFEALGATSATRPAPFRTARDGMALGEGAALVALVADTSGTGPILGRVLGFGASCDAVHVTAPDRTGGGLARAAEAALRDAGLTPAAVDLVSAHATATPFNDAAEARAIQSVLGSNAGRVVVHPFKASIGHTLGASGVLETLAVLDAMATGVHPAAAGSGAIDPDFRGALLERNSPAPAAIALKLSAAFGGANASLVVSAGERRLGDAPPLDARAIRVAAVGRARRRLDVASLGARGVELETKLSRLDPLSEYTVAAAADLVARCALQPAPVVTGVIVGSMASTLEADERFDARLRLRGARAVEPRRFPATSPNVCAGDCAIVFGLTGPALAVGAGPSAPIEALLVAWDLLASGDADELLVIAAEEVGPAVQAIWEAADWPLPAGGAVAALLSTRRGSSLDRHRLVRAARRARDEGGRLDGAEPGGPAFVAALAAASPS